MIIVLVLFLFGAANSASIFRNPQVAPGPVKHMPSNAPSAEYMTLENILGYAVTYTQDQAAEPISNHINTVIEEVAIIPSVRNAGPEPYLVSGPIAEYVVPFEIDIPGIQFTGEELLQPASVSVETAFVPEVVEYSILPKAEPVVDNYYKVDDGQLETVNPTYVTYDSFGSAPVITDPVTSLLDTFVKVDDGQLEHFNLLHVSNSAQDLVTLYDQAPVVETYAAPTLTDISDSIIYSAPEPVVFNYNLDVEAKFNNNPVLAISNMLKSFYKTPVSLTTKVPVIKMTHTSDDVITYSSTAVAPVPIVKTKAKLQTKSSSYKVEETDTESENVQVKNAEEEVIQVAEEEDETIPSESKSSNDSGVSERAEASEGSEGTEEGEGDNDAKAKSEGEEKSGDEEQDSDEE